MQEDGPFNNAPQRTQSLSDTCRTRESPNRRILNKQGGPKMKRADDEWVKKLEAGPDDEDEGQGSFRPTHARSSTMRKKKKEQDQSFEMHQVSPTSTTALNGKPTGIYGEPQKKFCCCAIL